MKDSTRTIIQSLMTDDATLTDRERDLLAVAVAGGEQQPTDSIMTRAEAAQLLRRDVHTIDAYARRGILKRIKYPGQTRAPGFRASDVRALIGEAP